MDRMTLGRLAEVVEGRMVDPGAAERPVGPDVVIDSRTATPGALFVAFAGDNVDGHDYIAAARDLGAAAALCQRIPDGLPEDAAAGCVIVSDPTAALGRLARWIIDGHPEVTVIGVTGSQGKTSTKDLLAQVLAKDGSTVAPEGSFNNEIGVPLTATRVGEGTRHLVSEMGARGRHHIDYLCSLTPPRIGVVLNVGQAHVGEFGSREAIAVAKGELVEQLPTEGWAVLNGTDPRVVEMAARTRARVALFSATGRPGTPADMLVWVDDIQADESDRHSFRLNVEWLDGRTESATVALRLVGRHHVANAAAAAAVARCIGLPLATIAETLSAAKPLSRWRMEVLERDDGVVVVNDAYNANPDSMLAACETLARMARRRRATRPGVESWAVLGQMFELGDVSVAEHEAIGRAVGSLQIDHLISLGTDAPRMVEAARVAGCENATVATDVAMAVELVRPAPGDVVLVKASRAMGLERVAEALVPQSPEASGEMS
ncbi:MAG TPA: UDP-N-acetylmuramoyl-tripeptide--D-alanyl-D-alanine ligase [Propionibacterium sp.]|nr:UDP-N-acetylmuramoyl-tripeptide--D-alanyl-D-alanine ligase [Propionibacterium sp.]